MLIYRERNTTDETGQVKNPNWWQEADQLAMYKCSRGVEPGSKPASGAGLELGITRFQVQRANHLAMQPPRKLKVQALDNFCAVVRNDTNDTTQLARESLAWCHFIPWRRIISYHGMD